MTFIKLFWIEFNKRLDDEIRKDMNNLNAIGTVTAIMLIISAASAGYGAYASVQAGKRQSQLAQYQATIQRQNAQVEQQNANLARKKASAEADRKRREGDALISKQRSLIGKSGVQLVGSPLEVLEDQEAENELDVQSILFSGELEARGFENLARNADVRAGESIFKGRSAKSAANIQAGQSLLSGAESIAGQYNYGKANNTLDT